MIVPTDPPSATMAFTPLLDRLIALGERLREFGTGAVHFGLVLDLSALDVSALKEPR